MHEASPCVFSEHICNFTSAFGVCSRNTKHSLRDVRWGLLPCSTLEKNAASVARYAVIVTLQHTVRCGVLCTSVRYDPGGVGRTVRLHYIQPKILNQCIPGSLCPSPVCCDSRCERSTRNSATGTAVIGADFSGRSSGEPSARFALLLLDSKSS